MKFHERFDIDVGRDEAERRFINRVKVRLVDEFLFNLDSDSQYGVQNEVAYRLGVNDGDQVIRSFHKSNFFQALQAIEAIYRYFFPDFYDEERYQLLERIEEIVVNALSDSETDLGVEWQKGMFVRKGAKVLDEKLVNDVLNWLRKDSRFENVLRPFEKGLNSLLRAHYIKEGLKDVVRDMYEALEALSKVVTEKDRELSRNQEKFLSTIKAPDGFKSILKSYVDYANELHRHAASPGDLRLSPSEKEVEYFIYLTGIFIRFAMP